MNLKEIRDMNINGIYVSSYHSSGFSFCELDWRQDCVWEEGELLDGDNIESFFDNLTDKRFWLTQKDAFNETNTYYYTKEEIVTVRIFKNNEWVDDEFVNLKCNDRFQIIQPDGALHFDDCGNTDWIATSNPYLNQDGIYQIDTNK